MHLPTNRQGEHFPGLLRLVYDYLNTLDINGDAVDRIEKYLDLIRRRADGEWISFSAGDALIPSFRKDRSSLRQLG